MTQETDIALLKQAVRDLKDESEQNRIEVQRLKDLDNNRMRAGLIGLVALVGSLLAYIWNRQIGNGGG